jgi:FkbM family methyltransferase
MKKVLNSILDKLGLKVYFLSHLPLGFDMSRDIRNHFDDFTVETILDVGANVGQSSIYFSSSFPDAHIIALEPVQSTYEILVNAVSPLKAVKALKLALGEKNEMTEILIKENSLWNSLATHDQKSGVKEKVEVVTLDELVHREKIEKISILKIDVEGFELEVLRGGQNTFNRGMVDFVYCEVGMNKEDQSHTYFGEVKEQLEELGFRFMSLYGASLIGHNGHFANALFFNSGSLSYKR